MKHKLIAIHQPNFLPWLGFFYKWSRADRMVFLDDAAFSKGSLTNRVSIHDMAGCDNKAGCAAWLTIPVLKKGRLNQAINETLIQTERRWRDSVTGKIRSAYAKTPFFKQYFPEFEAVLKPEHRLLAGLNVALLQWAAEKLEIDTPWVLSSSLEGVEGTATDRLISICRGLGASAYLSGFGGRKYQEEALYKENGIELTYYDFQHPVYPQMHRGDFIPGLSVLDLLFNCGPGSVEIFKKS